MDLVPCLQAGSRFGKLCFSHDSRYLFCCCGSVVKVFNTTNGECVHDLTAHSKAVTGVFLNPSNVLQIVTCGQDGCLIFWDYLDGVKLKEHDLHMPLYGIVSVNADTKSMMIIAETSAHKKTYCLMQWKRSKTNPNEFSKPKMLIENCAGDYGLISFGCSREFVASASGHMLTIYSMKKESKRITPNGTLSPDPAGPQTPIRVFLTFQLQLVEALEKEKSPIKTPYYFFSGIVGSNLLSGGHECVLVKWQMSNTNLKDFKPRMGAPLTKILCSPDGTFYATEHSDNAVQLSNISMKVLQVYRGLTRGNMGLSSDKNPIPCGLKFDHRSQALVTNGLPGHLQFYSLALNRQLFNLDIVGQNYISPENIERPKVVTEVIAAAVSGSGEWLATFESWDDGLFTPELRLKFWSWSTEAQTYSLNTTVEGPHDGKVKRMIFRPQSELNLSLVTIGSDCCFKLWTLVDDTDIYRSNVRWDCESVGFYRGMEVSCADFSQDATALAVGFEHLVTLWDPDNNIVQATVSNSLPEREPISHILFGNKQCSHLLVVATTKTLLVWDLLTLTVQWKLPSANITSLFRDPASDLMAFVSAGASLNVFSPRNSTMIYQHENVSRSCVLDALFIPDGRHRGIAGVGWPGTSQIYIFNADEELLTLDYPKQQKSSETQVKISQNLPQSAVSAFLAEKMVRETGDSRDKIPLSSRNQVDDSFISVLLHSNEPVSLHCDQYLKNLLVKSSAMSSSTIDTGDDDIDEDDRDDSSESEMETDEKGSALPALDTTDGDQIQEEEDMNKLLSPSLDWIQWCAKLKLK
ncbi:WD repeat-containing protein 75 [Aplysia californica]|uniref:WD repeat-containing protein 75 n=1 Tax=Aplysia californica TaxID=6500 RepID=A0ABM0JEC9_APLCA|nr:WD repeat-containing protein 75 [Aplysia californica]